jgi:hypothetical protein
MRLRAVIFTFLYLGLALALAWLAMSIPMHFRAVSPLVLAEAGEGTPTLERLADDYLDAGQVGPASLLLRAQGGDLRDRRPRAVIEELLEAHPLYALSGGPAPYYEQWLKAAGISPERVPPERRAVLPVLLPQENRRHLLTFLEQSSNRTVRALLATRELSDYQHFLPVFSAGGHPLDATILATALLEQSNAWSPGMSRLLRERAAAAPDDPEALVELENVYLGVLTLGTRLDWSQLTALLRTVPDASTLNGLNAATQLAGERFPELYAGALLSGDTPALTRYLGERGEDGWRVLGLALEMGQGALTRMTDFNQPLYDPPDFIRALPLFSGQAVLRGFTERQPRLALLGKTLALVLSGYLLALALESLVRSFLRPHPHPRGPAVHAFHLVSGLGLAALVWILSEPKLLEFAPNEGGTLRIQLANLTPKLSAESPADSAMFDQVTLLVLLLFLVLQGIVFLFSLIKIKEIRAQPVAAAIKLRLLDNEENLFDLGLYVGLGGTVSALLLVVLEWVDASLMAAYASTLFGIIFVAILKIMVLRPYRRRLILEATATGLSTGPTGLHGLSH